MYTSKNHLHLDLGVNMQIAAFFVDRKVPVENRYWKGRYLYVAGGTGYLFIPLFFDLQYKCGASIEQVLSEDYVELMEAILHSAALYEFNEIGFAEHIDHCKALLVNKVRNQELFDDLLGYFNNDLKLYKNFGTCSRALNRGDTLLFILTALDIPEDVTNKIIENWYALVPSFLLMDDIVDLKNDRENNEENSIADFGPGSKGVEKGLEFLRSKFGGLKVVNQQLGEFLERSLERKLQSPYLQSILN